MQQTQPITAVCEGEPCEHRQDSVSVAASGLCTSIVHERGTSLHERCGAALLPGLPRSLGGLSKVLRYAAQIGFSPLRKVQTVQQKVKVEGQSTNLALAPSGLPHGGFCA